MQGISRNVEFSLEMRIHKKQMGRNIYNISIIRKEFDGQKVIYYLQQLEERIVKKKGMDEIKTFLIHEKFINARIIDFGSLYI
jgi:hypothetical protein